MNRNSVFLGAEVLVMLVAVGFGGYKLGENQVISSNQRQLNHCLDVADANLTDDLQSLNVLGISTAATRAKAESNHAAAVNECQIRYQIK